MIFGKKVRCIICLKEMNIRSANRVENHHYLRRKSKRILCSKGKIKKRDC